MQSNHSKGQVLEQLRAIKDDIEMNGARADWQLILASLDEIENFVRLAEKPRGPRPKAEKKLEEN